MPGVRSPSQFGNVTKMRLEKKSTLINCGKAKGDLDYRKKKMKMKMHKKKKENYFGD